MKLLICDPVSPKGIGLLQQRPEFDVVVLPKRLSEAELLPAIASSLLERVTVLVTLPGASAATSTVTVIVGYAADGASESERVQLSGDKLQDHPEPEMAVAESPAGNASVTVMVPVAAVLPALLTVMLYVWPVSPCVKLPAWDTAIARFSSCT